MSSAPLVLLADDCADALDVIEGSSREAGFETARAPTAGAPGSASRSACPTWS